MIPDKVPKEDVFHGSEDLKKEAHISSFEKYKELYVKSIESPDGKYLHPATQPWIFPETWWSSVMSEHLSKDHVLNIQTLIFRVL